MLAAGRRHSLFGASSSGRVVDGAWGAGCPRQPCSLPRAGPSAATRRCPVDRSLECSDRPSGSTLRLLVVSGAPALQVSKLMKSLQGGGFPDVLAKLMASAFHAAAGPPGAVRAFGAPLASGVQVFSAGCSDGLGEYMRALLLQPPGDVKARGGGQEMHDLTPLPTQPSSLAPLAVGCGAAGGGRRGTRHSTGGLPGYC